MLIYTIYDFVLGQKQVHTKLKNADQPASYTLQIVVSARKFLGLHFGAAFMKTSRLYDDQGRKIASKYYPEDLKEEISRFKSELKIPHFFLWKGIVYAAAIILVVAVVTNFKNKAATNRLDEQHAHMVTQLSQLKQGQQYGVSFFTDKDANSIDGVPSGWIRITNIVGDTIFVQRAKTMSTSDAVFDMEKIASIKPQGEQDWEEKMEKINYPLLKRQLQQQEQKRYDVTYIGSDHDKYSGIVFTIKGAQ